jgi:hypothetical protein
MAEVKGGEKLEAALATLATKLAVPATLRVGFLENAKYPDGTPVAAVAAWQNYGTGSIPPRPFFSNMVAQKSPERSSASYGNRSSTRTLRRSRAPRSNARVFPNP